MTPDDLRKIESTLGLTLPESFQRFMLNYPQELLDASVSLGNDEETYTERACEVELVNTADAIIALNKSDPAEYHYSMRPEDWPPTHLVIGHNQCGDVYGIDTTIENSPVYMGGPHLGEYDEDGVAESLEAFASQLVASYKERQ
jgi:hypothetical protein